MKNAIVTRLEGRTTEQLKSDAREAMLSTDEGANIVFVLALEVLESRLSGEEYQAFEQGLWA